MKTIPMHHQVSTEYILKIIALLSLMVLTLCSCNADDIYQPIRYTSSDEVLELFAKSKDKFEGVLKILNDPALYDYVDKKIHNADGWDNRKLNVIKKSGLLSKEEYDEVETFFKRFGPLSLSSRPLYYSFAFVTNLVNLEPDVSRSAIFLIYIIDIDSELELNSTIRYLEQRGEVNHIADHWYYIIDVERK